MKKIFNEILMTISFLSRIPAGGTGEIKKIPRYFTIVGYLSGLLYMILTAIMGKGVFQVVLTMVVAFFFFDLFHFDGLLDTLDGFLNQNKEKRLEIMSKGDTGPFAMFYGIVFIGTFFYCLTQADSLMLLYSGVFSRFTMNVVLNLSKPVKKTGLGALFYPYDSRNSIIALLITLPLLANPKFFLISFALSVLCGTTMHLIAKKQIGGYTGDVLGASCLISNLFIMISLILIK